MNILLVFLCLLLYGINSLVFAKILDRLRNAHADVFERLGAPTFAESNVSKSRLNLLAFLWGFRFLRTSDAELKILCVTSILVELLMLAIVFGLAGRFAS